jgi:hypothetical protein
MSSMVIAPIIASPLSASVLLPWAEQGEQVRSGLQALSDADASYCPHPVASRRTDSRYDVWSKPGSTRVVRGQGPQTTSCGAASVVIVTACVLSLPSLQLCSHFLGLLSLCLGRQRAQRVVPGQEPGIVPVQGAIRKASCWPVCQRATFIATPVAWHQPRPCLGEQRAQQVVPDQGSNVVRARCTMVAHRDGLQCVSAAIV